MDQLEDPKEQNMMRMRVGVKGKPIQDRFKKAYVSTRMKFIDRTHGDPDNIQKAVADALFADDKYVAGDYDFDYTNDVDAVGIDVTIEVQW